LCGNATDRKRGKAQCGRGPQLLCPRRHGSGDAPCAAFLGATELTLNERLHIFRDFFKAGEQAAAEFNIHEHAKRGQHFKDWFCPDSMEFAADHFKLDARYGRVLYLQDYASYIKDSFVSELCDLDRDLMLSIAL